MSVPKKLLASIFNAFAPVKVALQATFATAAQCEAVHERLFAPILPVPQKKTDIGVVMGGTATSGEAARFAAQEYLNGRFEKIVVAGGAKAEDKMFERALFLADGDSWALLPERDFNSGLTEAEYMKEVLVKMGVPKDVIEVVGTDCKHMDKVVDAVLRSDSVRDADSMTVMAYGPGAQRVRSTIRFQNEQTVDGALKTRFDGPIVPIATGVGNMTTANWKDYWVARYYVFMEAHNMDPARARTAGNPEADGFIGQYSLDPAVHREEEITLTSGLPDMGR